MKIDSHLMDEYNKLSEELYLEDHVSKSELRAWCEERLARVAQDRKGLRFNDDREDVMALEGMKEMLHCVLRKFCKEVS